MLLKNYISIIITVLTLSAAPFSVNASACSNNKVKLQILGSGGPELNDQRASTSYLIWINNKARILVDAGSGSSFNFEKTGANINDLKAILLTHLHVDHSADIPAYIKASFFTDRDKDLLILGPAGNQRMPSTQQFIHNLFGKKSAFRYLNDYLDPAQQNEYHIRVKNIALSQKKIFQHTISTNLKVKATAVHHGPIAAIAWRVDVADCSITFSGDMSNQYKTIAALAKNTNLFVAHNAIPETATGVAAFLHMRPSAIGTIANKATVKKLVLSHRMNRTIGKEKNTLSFIKKHYKGEIQFANDLDIIVPQ
ncbi:Arylsulfatase [hydrothermal vent metagenome]|uniref:Arylsulfatase n=1 Tax=hydrothermal vent metagenome TaxID=652676 RepID=A0A3B0YLF8_9ZZZZ